MNINSSKHVFIGMSGGIDSSAAAKILIDQGYKVTGLTFVGLGKENQESRGKKNFTSKSSRKCCSTEEVLVAKEVCYTLGIPHITLDLAAIFKEKVRIPFMNSYINGETPNPCMLCNRHVKLGALVDYALQQGADYVAMGHYTGIDCINGEYLLKAGTDKSKDQSYFLALLKPEILPHLLFPLADKEKEDIKKLIDSTELPLKGNKIESQDVCFIDNDYRDYLEEQGVQRSNGTILYSEKPVGTHKGTPFYALGQRRGLGVSLGEKVFVREINAETNTLILGEKPISKVFRVNHLNIFSSQFGEGEWDIQIRYRSARIPGQIKYLDKHTLEVTLSTPQEIVSPGQYAVFYRNGYIYGAGKIQSTDLLK